MKRLAERVDRRVARNIAGVPRLSTTDHLLPLLVEAERYQRHIGPLGRNRAHIPKIDALSNIDQDRLCLSRRQRIAEVRKVVEDGDSAYVGPATETSGQPIA